MPLSAASMLGPRLVNNAGADVPTTCLRGKVVALYFSASWCGPCRGFTPQLVKTYNTLQAAGKAFEVVLVGSDRTKNSFEAYHKEMPWLAVPFDDRDRKMSLSTKFRVHGIPTLIILDIDGSVITAEGREQLGEDPNGDRFPWRPKPLSDLIGTVFQTKNGLRGVEAIQGKSLALYFSAHWTDRESDAQLQERLRRFLRRLPGMRRCVKSCPPCRGFTPHLVKTYKSIKEREGGDDVEFLFVSSDRDQESFDEYFSEMPWLAIPYADSRKRKALGQRFGVRGIPALATVGLDGTIVNHVARPAATADPKGLEFPWWPKAVEDLAVSSQSNGFHLQEIAALVVFMEGADDADQKEVEEVLMPIAEAEVKAGKEEGEPALIFFTAKSEADVPTQVRNVCGLKEVSDTPQMVIVNVPNNGAFYVPEDGPATPVNSDTITAFISAYKEGALERQQLKRG